MDEAVVTKITEVSPDVKQYTIQLTNSKFSGKSGQYTMIQTSDGNKPYSTMIAGEQKAVLMVRNYDSTQYMSSIGLDDIIRVDSELRGNLFLRNSDKPIALLSTGSGISPLMGITYEYIEKNGDDALFVFGEKNKRQQLYKSIIEQFGVVHNIEHRYVLSREEWSGREGHVQEHIGDIATKQGQNRDIYISGVPDMVLETKSFLTESGVDKERIYVESYLE